MGKNDSKVFFLFVVVWAVVWAVLATEHAEWVLNWLAEWISSGGTAACGEGEWG